MNCNKLALDYLHNGNTEGAVSLLKKAKTLLRSQGSNSKLQAMTYNNLAILYRKTRVPLRSLKYLMKALSHQSDISDVAGTHLNIAAIKAEMRMHEEALTHSQKALNLLKRNFSPTSNMAIGLIIAYHNVGLQYENMRQGEEAMRHYQNGMELALEQLGRAHPLTVELSKSHRKALEGALPTHTVRDESLPLVIERPPPLKQNNERKKYYKRLPPKQKFRSVSPKGSIDIFDIQAPRLFQPSRESSIFPKKFDSLVTRDFRKSSTGSSVGETVQNIGIRLENLQQKINDFSHKMKPMQEFKLKERVKRLRGYTKRRAAKVILKYLRISRFRRNHCAKKIQHAFRTYMVRKINV